MKNNNKEYAKFLKELSIKGSPTGFGACGLFKIEFDVDLDDLLPGSVYGSWEHYSGWDNHPVPSPGLNLSPVGAYYELPKWKGTYGKLRMSWCAHLADYFEDLANEK